VSLWQNGTAGNDAAGRSLSSKTICDGLVADSFLIVGCFKLSQIWYERALNADPNHVLTWQYYGMWQIEQGNRDQAQYHLSRIAAICGTGCEEYRSLAAALEKPPGTGLDY
jgi:tetratricopeptide (TPR) repeat protein